jgi:hypothetical protein
VVLCSDSEGTVAVSAPPERKAAVESCRDSLGGGSNRAGPVLSQLRASTVAGIGSAVCKENTGRVGNKLPNQLPLLHHFVFIREQLRAIVLHIRRNK